MLAAASFSALMVQPPMIWQVDALQTEATALIMLLAVGWLASVVCRRPSLTLHLSQALLAIQLWLTIAACLFLLDLSPYLGPIWWTLLNVWWWVLGAWAVVPIFRVLRGSTGQFAWWQAVLAVALTALLMTPVHFLYPQQHFITDWEQDWTAPVATLDAEALLSRQSQMVEASLQAIAASDSDQVDIFALTFAAYGSQDLFANEAALAARRLTEHFNVDQARTLALVNNDRTLAEKPLATGTNLVQALAGLGAKADRNDLLFIYVTSHGHPDSALNVEMANLPLSPLRPLDLQQALASSGFTWRVVVVSSCYSGGFVEPLADDNTVIITAARADRTSFGCTDDAELSYFGEAFVDQALGSTRSLRAAWEMARTTVTERELSEGYEPSEPQLHVGAAIADYLSKHTAIEP